MALKLVDQIAQVHQRCEWTPPQQGVSPEEWRNGDELLPAYNLLAEFYFELGMVGLLFFLAITWAIFKVFAHSIPGLLTLFYYINAMSSGDIPGNAPLFLSLFVACVVYNSNNARILEIRKSKYESLVYYP